MNIIITKLHRPPKMIVYISVSFNTPQSYYPDLEFYVQAFSIGKLCSVRNLSYKTLYSYVRTMDNYGTLTKVGVAPETARTEILTITQ